MCYKYNTLTAAPADHSVAEMAACGGSELLPAACCVDVLPDQLVQPGPGHEQLA
jgi:hypothetical protein